MNKQRGRFFDANQAALTTTLDSIADRSDREGFLLVLLGGLMGITDPEVFRLMIVSVIGTDYTLGKKPIKKEGIN
jgi:hypothetical protein